MNFFELANEEKFIWLGEDSTAVWKKLPGNRAVQVGQDQVWQIGAKGGQPVFVIHDTTTFFDLKIGERFTYDDALAEPGDWIKTGNATATRKGIEYEFALDYGLVVNRAEPAPEDSRNELGMPRLGLPEFGSKITQAECSEPGCEKGMIADRSCLTCGELEFTHDPIHRSNPISEDHDFVWDEDPKVDIYRCPVCHPEQVETVGLVYVAVGHGRACVLESENTALSNDLSEVSGCPDDVGLDFQEDEGIWKGVVKVSVHRSWEGEIDVSYDVIGQWQEVESYPEPYCDLYGKKQGACRGMLGDRGGGTWACDTHAGQVA